VIAPVRDSGQLRTFATGATRDTSQQKLDPFGFISPVALHRFSEYMHRHRVQSDGNLRDSDNWKKGMPREEYVRSLIRHVMDFWLVTSGEVPRYDTKVSDPDEIACSILFNIQGYLHEQGTARNRCEAVVSDSHGWGKMLKNLDLLEPKYPYEQRPMNHINVDQQLSKEVDDAFDRITIP